MRTSNNHMSRIYLCFDIIIILIFFLLIFIFLVVLYRDILLLLFLTIICLIQYSRSLIYHHRRSLLRLYVKTISFIPQYLANDSHLVILFTCMNIPLKGGMSSVHYFPLLTYMLSRLPCSLIFLFITLRYGLLLFEVLIYRSDLLLKDCKVPFNSWLAVFNKQIYLLDMIFLSWWRWTRWFCCQKLSSHVRKVLRFQLIDF